MKKLLFCFALSLGTLGSAQKLKKEDVVGFWKLKESGFYQGKKKTVKIFDKCRLMRNYSIREDGFAIYSYTEGDVENCSVSEPRLSFWRMISNRIQFYSDENNILEEVVVTINHDKTMTLSSYIPILTKDTDPKLEQAFNTIHYDILEKQY